MFQTPVTHFEFELDDDTIVADPSYVDFDLRRLGNITVRLSTKPGRWKADVTLVEGPKNWGGSTRVAEIRAHHADGMPKGKFVLERSEVGVDTGMAGIMAAKDFQKLETDQWHKISSTEVIERGIVTSTGLGDGGYPCITHRDDQGRVDAIKIEFMSPSLVKRIALENRGLA